MSIVPASDPSSIRFSSCDQVHFFASAEAAASWLDHHTSGSVAPVDDAQRVGRSIIQSLPVASGTADC